MFLSEVWKCSSHGYMETELDGSSTSYTIGCRNVTVESKIRIDRLCRRRVPLIKQMIQWSVECYLGWNIFFNLLHEFGLKCSTREMSENRTTKVWKMPEFEIIFNENISNSGSFANRRDGIKLYSKRTVLEFSSHLFFILFKPMNRFVFKRFK